MSGKKRSREFTRRIGNGNPGPGRAQAEPGGGGGLGTKGRVAIASGMILAALGYILLRKADPAGQNIYAKLSPIALLAGYLLIPAALLIPETPGKSSQDNPQAA